MTYKVIQWAIGTVGKEAVIGIAGHPDLELVGAWVRSEEKDGRDVGELADIGPTGVTATRDKDALIALDADCVCVAQGRDWARDPMPTFEVLLQLLRSGKNVVNLWWPSLVNPRAVGGDVHERLDKACQEGGSSFFTSGMDPGFGPLGLAKTALNLARDVEQIHTYEFFNNGYWDAPEISMFFGFGQMEADKSPLLLPGATSGMHGTTLHLLAEAIGLEIEEFVEEHSVIRAEETFDTPAGHIPEGTISGVRYVVKGMVGGEPRVVLDHVERIRDEDYQDLGFQGNGYRVEIEGAPRLRLDMEISSPRVTTSDPYHGVAIATAMSVVNAIPAVCAAPPGVLTIVDLPFFPGKKGH